MQADARDKARELTPAASPRRMLLFRHIDNLDLWRQAAVA